VITYEERGRRTYVLGDTYAMKDRLRAAGCRWDPDARAWWSGKRETIVALVAELASAPEAQPAYVPAAGEAMVPVAGQTYPVRDGLRRLGGQWDAAAKAWLMPASKLAEAQALVAAPPPEQPYRPRYQSCKQCGARPGPRGWPRIYQNGVCSDCYRDAIDDDY
jgi:hypothetical protein